MSEEFTDSGLACLTMLMGFLQVPADIDQLKHEIGKDKVATPADIVRSAKRAGLRAKIAKLTTSRLEFSALPAIASGIDGNFFIIGKVHEGRVLIQPPGGAPESLTIEELEDRWTGEAILLTRRDKAFAEDQKFDVTWFIPALVCLLYTSPSPRDATLSRMPSSA